MQPVKIPKRPQTLHNNVIGKMKACEDDSQAFAMNI